MTIAEMPTYGDAWMRRGQARAAMGRDDDAMQDFQECLKLTPEPARKVSRARACAQALSMSATLLLITLVTGENPMLAHSGDEIARMADFVHTMRDLLACALPLPADRLLFERQSSLLGRTKGRPQSIG